MNDGKTGAAELEGWVRAFFAAVDARDVELTASFFSDDIRLVFGNHGVIVGRESARRSFAQRAAALRAVRHDITGLWGGQDGDYRVISAEAQVTYTLHDDRQVTVPCTSTLRIHHDLIADYRVFIDMTPVFAAT